MGALSTLDTSGRTTLDGKTEASDRKGTTFVAWIPHIIAVAAALLYGWYFLKGLTPYWFNPQWTTDDALQQSFPFHKVYNPELFKGDIITKMMEGYLTPVQYWLSWVITYFTADPIMTGHWVMLIQLVLTSGFITAAVYRAGGLVPACFAFIWLLHTRHIMQRLTGGLPRGWAAPVIAAYLFCMVGRHHKGVIALLFIGALVHPPSTFVCALAYGFYLLWRVAWRETRAAALRPFFTYSVAGPAIALVTWLVVKMPPDLGTMASYDVAASMPEFSREGGRFPFVPLMPLLREFRIFGFMAFTSRLHHIPFTRELMVVATASMLFFAFLIVDYRKGKRKQWVMGAELATFAFAAICAYLASRQLAFKLYVPDRHLQFPMGLFFVTAFSIAAWRAFHSGAGEFRSAAWKHAKGSFCALLALAALIFTGSGNGLQGSANFNVPASRAGHVNSWLEKNTPIDSLIAGYPDHVDLVPLFAKRQVYISTETAHPFYDKYYSEVRRRIDITLRAHFARDLKELLTLLEPEGIDYFVFRRKLFYPEELQKADYFKPFDQLVYTLTRRGDNDYAYRQLPRKVEAAAPFMPFKDDQSAVVDIAELRRYIDKNGL